MLRKTPVAALAATRKALVGNGVTFSTGGECRENSMTPNMFSVNERGVRSSSPFLEPNTAVYDSLQSWTYFQPLDVNIDKLPAPEPRYYQRLTRKPWDVSSTELLEIQSRKKYLQMWFTVGLVIYGYFLMSKEKSYSGVRGADGYWVLLPKYQPERF